MEKTWILFPISSVLPSANDKVFVDSIVPSLKQEYSKYASSMDNIKLKKIVMNAIDGVREYDYSCGYHLLFENDERVYDLRCCVFAQFPETTHFGRSLLLVVSLLFSNLDQGQEADSAHFHELDQEDV